MERAQVHAEHRRDSRAGSGRGKLSLEIERKFRPPEAPPWLPEQRSEHIDQGYLAISEGVEEVRLRRIGDSLRLTVKRGSGETREEIEIELGEDQFDAVWPLTEGRRVAKRRYFVDQDELTFEADVYEGELEGMITVEVEFDSEGDSQAFEPPDWFGQEVTGDSAYSNESFALHGNPESEGDRRRHRGGGNGGRRRGRDPSRG